MSETTGTSRITLEKTTCGVVYTPSFDERPPGAMYPRVIRLRHNGTANGTLLATFEQYTWDTPVFSIYRSEDDGLTWSLFSKVHDTKNGWGMRYQPQLFEVPRQTGGLAAGTLLCAGSSIPSDMSRTELLLFKSTDKGASWSFVSSIISGGKAWTDHQDGERPVWEPFLHLDASGELVCCYSDERYLSEGYNQLLAHRTSRDGGLSWSAPVFDVAVPDKVLRPGMPIVQRMADGRFIMVYEVVGLPGYPLYIRFSEDGQDWGDPAALGLAVKDPEGRSLGSTPYLIHVDAGGPNGTLILSGRIPDTGEGLLEPGYFLTNSDNGEGPWHRMPMLNHYDATYGFTGYSQSMVDLEGDRLLQLTSVQINPRLSQIAYGIGRLHIL